MLFAVASTSTTSTRVPRQAGVGLVVRLLLLWAVAAAGVGAIVAEVLIAIVAVVGGTDAGAVLELGVWTVPVAAVAGIALALLRRPHGD